MYISVNSVRKRISIVLFTQPLKYLHRPIGIEYWNLKLMIFCSASPLMGTATSLSDIERSATSLSGTEARDNKPFS